MVQSLSLGLLDPVGLGAPIYSKLDTDISAALMSING